MLEMVGKRRSGRQPGDPGADDNGVPTQSRVQFTVSSSIAAMRIEGRSYCAVSPAPEKGYRCNPGGQPHDTGAPAAQASGIAIELQDKTISAITQMVSL
jgi:hypothetical protein